MIREYTELHNMGITHSIEAFLNGERVGGLYGLAMGEVFLENQCFIPSRMLRKFAWST